VTNVIFPPGFQMLKRGRGNRQKAGADTRRD
jgi:hypothetical protein